MSDTQRDRLRRQAEAVEVAREKFNRDRAAGLNPCPSSIWRAGKEEKARQAKEAEGDKQ